MVNPTCNSHHASKSGNEKQGLVREFKGRLVLAAVVRHLGQFHQMTPMKSWRTEKKVAPDLSSLFFLFFFPSSLLLSFFDSSFLSSFLSLLFFPFLFPFLTFAFYALVFPSGNAFSSYIPCHFRKQQSNPGSCSKCLARVDFCLFMDSITWVFTRCLN